VFDKSIMKAAYRRSDGALRRPVDQEPGWKKVYTDYAAFRDEQHLWFRFTEAGFDNFMQSGRSGHRQDCAGAEEEVIPHRPGRQRPALRTNPATAGFVFCNRSHAFPAGCGKPHQPSDNCRCSRQRQFDTRETAIVPHHPLIASLRGGDTGKVMSARHAVQLIRDGDTIATAGFVGIGFAENIAVALELRFLEAKKAMPTASAIRVT
jgi:hypothetical protein